MGLSTSLDEGKITSGETKQLKVTPNDDSGSAISASTLKVTFTKPSGSTDSKTISDFSKSGDTYSLDYTFDEAGKWQIVIEGTDSSSRIEKVTFDQHVQKE